MRFATLTLTLTIPLLAPAAAPKGSPEAKELKHLNGTWAVQAVRFGEEAIPHKLIGGRTVKIEGETYTLAADDGVTEAEYTVKLDVGKKPKWVSLTQPGRTEPCRLGIYEVKGDTLKVAMVSTKGKRARPKDFTGGPGVNVVTLKRAKGK